MSQKIPRVWFITGCSTGFGRVLAAQALAQGDKVIATARKVDQIKNLEQKYPQTAKTITLDVTHKTTV
jgi:NADP-dependent 3-hydroxy acid dehydrogenase YdfG